MYVKRSMGYSCLPTDKKLKWRDDDLRRFKVVIRDLFGWGKDAWINNASTLVCQSDNPADYPCIKGEVHKFVPRYDKEAGGNYIYDICEKCGKIRMLEIAKKEDK